MKKILLTLCFSIICTIMVYADNLTASVVHAYDGVASGEIHLTITGGKPAYTIEWTGPAGFTANTPSITGLIAGTYHVTVTDQYCGVATLDVIVEAKSTSIENLSPISVKIFPNPVKDNIQILFEQIGEYEVSLYNVLGQKVYSETLNNLDNTINVEKLASGMYTLQISNGVQSYVHKLSKL